MDKLVFRCESPDLQAEPLPELNTKSMGQPQFKSTKSTPSVPNSLAITSAAGTRDDGLLPHNCTPKVRSLGCRRTRDHSEVDEERKEVASPISEQVISAPSDAHKRRKGCILESVLLENIVNEH